PRRVARGARTGPTSGWGTACDGIYVGTCRPCFSSCILTAYDVRKRPDDGPPGRGAPARPVPQRVPDLSGPHLPQYLLARCGGRAHAVGGDLERLLHKRGDQGYPRRGGRGASQRGPVLDRRVSVGGTSAVRRAGGGRRLPRRGRAQVAAGWPRDRVPVRASRAG